MAPYLTPCREDAAQRDHPRAVYNALRRMARAGAPWRQLPSDFPPCSAVYHHAQRWLRAGCFEAMVHDLRAPLRVTDEREPVPSTIILDGQTLQSTPESGAQPGNDRAKRKKGSKAPIAVHTLGHSLEVIKLPAAKRGIAQLPPRCVVKRTVACTARFCRLARDGERLPKTLAALHIVALTALMLHRVSVLCTSA